MPEILERNYYEKWITINLIENFQMMRLRVCAQGFTVIALLIGVAYNAHGKKLERAAKQAEHEALAASVPQTK